MYSSFPGVAHGYSDGSWWIWISHNPPANLDQFLCVPRLQLFVHPQCSSWARTIPCCGTGKIESPGAHCPQEKQQVDGIFIRAILGAYLAPIHNQISGSSKSMTWEAGAVIIAWEAMYFAYFPGCKSTVAVYAGVAESIPSRNITNLGPCWCIHVIFCML